MNSRVHLGDALPLHSVLLDGCWEISRVVCGNTIENNIKLNFFKLSKLSPCFSPVIVPSVYGDHNQLPNK